MKPQGLEEKCTFTFSFPWYINKGYVSTVPKHIETINGDDPRIDNKNRGYFPHIVENLCKWRDLLHIGGRFFQNEEMYDCVTITL